MKYRRDQETEQPWRDAILQSELRFCADHAIRETRLDSLARFPGCLARPDFFESGHSSDADELPHSGFSAI